MSSQRIGKYACLELERRYLLNKLPEDFTESVNGWSITDRYLPETRLRLRKMISISGNEQVFKLTQKYSSDNQGAFETTITNLYLTETEYICLERLEAKTIKKKRYPYKVNDHIFSIDVYEGRHQGLILAEKEFEDRQELDGFVMPIFALKEVTEDIFFTGGNLVLMTGEEFRTGLSARSGNNLRI